MLASRLPSALRGPLIRALTLFCAGATLLFTALFAATFLAPKQLEAAAHRYLAQEVTERLMSEVRKDRRWEGQGLDQSGALARVLQKSKQSAEELIESELPERIGEFLAEHCGCEVQRAAKKSSVASAVRERAEARVGRIKSLIDELEQRALAFYRGRFDALLGEGRIFSGINAALFALGAALLGFRRQDRGLLLVPTALLTFSTVVSISLYLTMQDWFWAFLETSYVGWGYLFLVGLVMGFFCDVLLNRGRITRSLLEALGASVSEVSC